jgi:hypothetical protein
MEKIMTNFLKLTLSSFALTFTLTGWGMDLSEAVRAMRAGPQDPNFVNGVLMVIQDNNFSPNQREAAELLSAHSDLFGGRESVLELMRSVSSHVDLVEGGVQHPLPLPPEMCPLSPELFPGSHYDPITRDCARIVIALPELFSEEIVGKAREILGR